MKITLIGLGKLGYPMAMFLSTKFNVRGYDINKKIVNDILHKKNNYLAYEENLKKYIKRKKSLKFFNNLEEAAQDTNACFITVPTPSNKNGAFSNKILINLLDKIAILIKNNKLKTPYLINICSTVSPGSCKEVLANHLIKNHKLNFDVDFTITYNPYFVALGNVLNNLINPDYILIGSNSSLAQNIITKIYSKVYPKSTKIFLLGLEEAELVKVFTNSFLTMKISFGNLIKKLAIKKNLALDLIMNALGSDKRIGKKFLNPGLPFAGPCLPRDNFAVAEYLNRNFISDKFSREIININNNSIKSIYKEIDHIIKLKFKKIGFLGAGYRPNTKSTDESVAIKIINYCVKKKIRVSLLDYYANYHNRKINKCSNLKDLFKSSEIVFLPFVDQKFTKIIYFSHKKIIWDSFYFLKSKKHRIVRNCFEIKFK